MHFKALTLFWMFISYAVCLMALGIFGYCKTASAASLYSSLGFGVLLLLNSYVFLKTKKLGSYIALFLTFSLSAVFASRFLITHKAIPAIMGVLSLWILLSVWSSRFGIHHKISN